MKKILLTLLTLTVFTTSSAYGDNRGAEDKIFNEPTKAIGAQFLLGFAEAYAAIMLTGPGDKISSEKRTLKNAQDELKKANGLFTSQVDKNISLGEFEKWSKRENLSTANKAAYTRVLASPVVSVEEKATAIKRADENVAKAREKVIKRAQKLGLMSKAFKVVRVGTIVVLVGDILTRVYVWNAMDANPTISPAATYILEQLSE